MFDNNMFNGMFGKIAPGMCRLSMNGGIAVKTTNGYKSYNVAKKKLTNCSNFVFNIGEDFFFVIPTNKVEIGDIILVNGKPKCVIAQDSNLITVINYEDSTVDTILPERHVFMGNTYFYGKIVSMFGNSFKKGNMNQIMKYMMMSQMLSGNSTTNNVAGNMFPIMMLMGGNSFDNMFDGMFDFSSANFSVDEDSDDEDESEDEE